MDENQDHDRDDFNDTPSTISLDTTESDRESSGDDNLGSSLQLSKGVSPGLRLPALCTDNLKACHVIFKAVFAKHKLTGRML